MPFFLRWKKNEANDQKIISALIWALMDKAIEKGQGFSNGSFILEDPSGRINKFLQQTEGKYIRSSHHLNGIEKETWGLDIPPTGENNLPAGKKHLLFKPITIGNKDLIFLKPEVNGTKGTAFVDRSYEYVKSVGRKKLPSIFGSDQRLEKRKEQVPKELLKEFKALLDSIPYDPGVKHNIYKQAKNFGIGKMYEVSGKLGLKGKPLFDKLKARYGNDYIDQRIGEEVILKLRDIEPNPIP